MDIGLTHYLVLSVLLFGVGLYGVLSRRNAVVILMCIELMLNAANLTLVAFSRYIFFYGQAIVIFSLVIAAAEVSVGLATIITFYRQRKNIDIKNINLLKW
ncbi:MAG: NADH-quinone oxidoreductase subunit NuoK [Dehalococcoidia bacterium]|jgi:NADH:ubiquinone oxidoreductase subunit K|nr:NADH-quinone oxidoreductase subunit NuoK [Dehalococcoidia bacterium]